MATRMLRVTIPLLLAAAATIAAQAQAPAAATHREIRDALRRGGLHEAARVSGGSYKTTGEAGPDVIVPDLTSLAEVSDAVVIGKPTSSMAHLTKNGLSITTDYRVVVGQTLSGDIPRDRQIVVSVPGGRVQFSDGLTAEVVILGLVAPEPQSRAVMFLEKNGFATDELVSWA